MKREDWIDSVIEALTDLADLDAQVSGWISDDGPQWFNDPGELCCFLFDDTGLGDLLEKGPVFSPELDAVLSEIGVVTDRVDFTQRTETLLKDPDWLLTAALARRALQMLAALEWDE